MQKTVALIKEAIKFGYLSVCSNSLCGFDYSLKMAIKKENNRKTTTTLFRNSSE